MSWLRIDDSISINGKLGSLTDAEFRALLALWSYCARRKNSGEFSLDEIRHAMYATPRGPKSVRPIHVSRFVDLGLVNTDDGVAFAVNDWSTYQPRDPSAAERMRRYRERHDERNGDRN